MVQFEELHFAKKKNELVAGRRSGKRKRERRKLSVGG